MAASSARAFIEHSVSDWQARYAELQHEVDRAMRPAPRITCALLLTAFVAGCATAPHMKLAPELAAVPPQPVTGRGAVLGRGMLAFDRWSSTVPVRVPNSHWQRISNTVAA